MFKNIPIIFILIHLTDNRNVALIYSVTINNKKGIVLGQGAPDVMSFLLLLSWPVSSNKSGHMFLGLSRVIFLQVVAALHSQAVSLWSWWIINDVIIKRPLGFELGVLSSFVFFFFSLLIFRFEENNTKQETSTPTTCGRLTGTLVSLILFIFFI